MRTRVKICGITNEKDMFAATNAGADALGFVFFNQSKRSVSVESIAPFIKKVPSYVSIVALFVDSEWQDVNDVITRLPIDELQFHGNETAEFCASFNRRYTKAVPMKSLPSKTAAESYIRQYSDASALLFDAFGGKTQGGSGERFDTQFLPETEKNIVIAGGLTVDNVGDVINAIHPFAVDVSSGVESEAGVKSSVKMNAFIEKVRLS